MRYDLAQYLLDEKIAEIIKLISDIYENLKYLECYYSKLFEKTKDKIDSKPYFDIFSDIKNKLQKI